MSVGIPNPSQRSGCDLSKLNVGFVRQQIAMASDCVGLVKSREKQLFKTFFSKRQCAM